MYEIGQSSFAKCIVVCVYGDTAWAHRSSVKCYFCYLYLYHFGENNIHINIYGLFKNEQNTSFLTHYVYFDAQHIAQTLKMLETKINYLHR